MRKRYCFLLTVIMCLLSVCITRAYCKNEARLTKETFIGTFQYAEEGFEDDDSIDSLEYLAIVHEDEDDFQFAMYNAAGDTRQNGQCEYYQDYLTFSIEKHSYILFCSNKNYYLVIDGATTKRLTKISDDPIVV